MPNAAERFETHGDNFGYRGVMGCSVYLCLDTTLIYPAEGYRTEWSYHTQDIKIININIQVICAIVNIDEIWSVAHNFEFT